MALQFSAGDSIVVTGASSGLGRDIARLFAQQNGLRVLAVARRKKELEALRDELAAAGKGVVVPVEADLGKREGQDAVLNACKAEKSLRGAVLNAGLTYFGESHAQDEASVEQIIAVNVSSVVRMTRELSKELVGRSTPSHVQLVSSLASFQPVPYQAVYAGSKAFVTNFGLSKYYELKDTPVKVLVFAPGGIDTEMLDKSGMRHKWTGGSMGIMSSIECAGACVDQFMRGDMLLVPGMINKLALFAGRLVPRSMMVSQAGKMYRDALATRPK